MLQNPTVRIFSFSFALLAIELAAIRLLPAKIPALSFFANLIFISAFFGFGLGALLSQRKPFYWLLPAGLALILGLLFSGQFFNYYSNVAISHQWLNELNNQDKRHFSIPLGPLFLICFTITALPFITLGQCLLQEMQKLPNLKAYARDILGSLSAIGIFAFGSFFSLNPMVWMVLATILLVVILAKDQKWIALSLAVIALFQSSFLLPKKELHWSPYYLIETFERNIDLLLFTNSKFHQAAFDFTQNDNNAVKYITAKFSKVYEHYEKLHQKKPQSVLIIGAGTGNDVVIARKNGVNKITAVEIDPVIARIGKDRNPSKPYNSEDVELVITDGRHYVETTTKKFDLVILGTLDSQATLSSHANVRLENFVYTKESLQRMAELLNPDGMIYSYVSVQNRTYFQRILATFYQAFPDRINAIKFNEATLFNYVFYYSPTASIPALKAPMIENIKREDISTDDWPFLYLDSRSIPISYWFVILFSIIAAIAAFFLTQKQESHSIKKYLPFFCLGIGFTLVEAAAIVRYSLFFGSIWQSSAFVFFFILLMVYIGNQLVAAKIKPPLVVSWILVLVFLALNVIVPLDWLRALPNWSCFGLLILLISLPTLMASICFSTLFEKSKNMQFSFGYNILGAMIGANFESISMVTGMNSVWLLAMAIYLAGLGFYLNEQKAA